jgi:hypothetical protein
MPKLGRSPVLGRVDDGSAARVLDWLEDRLGDIDRRADEHWRSYLASRASPYEALRPYDLMNALGYSYGTALARTLTDDLRPSLDAAGADGLADKARRTVDALWSFYAEIETRRSTRSTAVVSRAFREMEPKVPEWVDPAGEIRRALESPAWGGRGVYFNDFHYDVMIALATASQLLETFLAYHEIEQLVTFRREPSQAPEWLPTGFLDIPEEQEREYLKLALKAANDEARKRTWYGLRQERLPDVPFFAFLAWSNGAGRWFVEWSRTDRLFRARRGGETTATLDANEIIVPFPSLFVAKIAEAMEPLPLYQPSLEAKERGEYPDPTDAGVRRAVRSIIDTALPAADQEEKALLAMEWFDTLKRAKAGDDAARALLPEFIDRFRPWPGFARLFEEWFGPPREK